MNRIAILFTALLGVTTLASCNQMSGLYDLTFIDQDTATSTDVSSETGPDIGTGDTGSRDTGIGDNGTGDTGSGGTGTGDTDTGDTTDTDTDANTNTNTDTDTNAGCSSFTCGEAQLCQELLCDGANHFCTNALGAWEWDISADCDDGNGCTSGDTCSSGRCIGTGEGDFTPCETVTIDPTDRSYDICISGVCQSPGCGDASCNVPGPHFPLADTNQRACYNDSSSMTCPSAGQSFFGQDAQYGWDVAHAETERYTRTVPVTDQPIVEDNVTGLVWQGCAAGLSGSSCATGNESVYTWSEALAYCDSLTWGGYTDWRLPDPYELASIVDSGKYKPSIDSANFPATPSAEFWSSSSNAAGSDFAWKVYFGGGYVDLDDKLNANRVRCVRSGPFESRLFEPLTLSGDRVVRDTLTGLEWQGCAAGLSGAACGEGSATTHTWSEALEYCEGLSYGGRTDWRLPSRAELQSIMDQRAYSPAIDAVAFPGTPSAGFLSGSSYASSSGSAWGVSFSYGNVGVVSKHLDDRVRCVRSGP